MIAAAIRRRREGQQISPTTKPRGSAAGPPSRRMSALSSGESGDESNHAWTSARSVAAGCHASLVRLVHTRPKAPCVRFTRAGLGRNGFPPLGGGRVGLCVEKEPCESPRFIFREGDCGVGFRGLTLLMPDAEADVTLVVVRSQVSRNAERSGSIPLDERMRAEVLDEFQPLRSRAPSAIAPRRLRWPPTRRAFRQAASSYVEDSLLCRVRIGTPSRGPPRGQANLEALRPAGDRRSLGRSAACSRPPRCVKRDRLRPWRAPTGAPMRARKVRLPGLFESFTAHSTVRRGIESA